MKLLNKITLSALALPIAVVPAISITSCNKQQEQKEETSFEINGQGLVTLKDKTATKVKIPATINDIEVHGIAENGFKDSKVETVSFEKDDQITRIDNYAFKGCSSLKSFVLPKNVKYLGIAAFSGCTSLATFNFANGIRLQTLLDRTFEDTNLYEITIPASVMFMKPNLFAYSGAHKITKIHFSNIKGWKQNGTAISEDEMKAPDNCANHLQTFAQGEANNWGYTGIERTAKTAEVKCDETTFANFTLVTEPAENINEREGSNTISFSLKAKEEKYNGEYVIWVNNDSSYKLKETVYTIDAYNTVSCYFAIDDWSYITDGTTLTILAMKK